MNNPKISVLMPVFNAEKFLKEAIDSILNQTFADFEFIIINDGSTDNSEKIIMSYDDNRIRYYKNKKNLGVARTLNKGLKLAKGKYIARMDADDISLPTRLEHQYNLLKNDKKLIIVFTSCSWIDEKGEIISRLKDKYTSPEAIYYQLQFRNCLAHTSAMFKKDIICDEFGGYNEKYQAEDNELWLRISSKYKIVKINKKLVKIRLSAFSKTGIKQEIIDQSSFLIARNNLRKLTGKSVDYNTLKIIAGENFFKYTSEDIRNAMKVLEEINRKIISYHPSFLDHSQIIRICIKRKNLLKSDLLIAFLFTSKFNQFFKSLYGLYRFSRRNLYA